MIQSFVDSKQFLIEWNETFPLDIWWRRKYNIPFNSKKHRNISYLDIFYEWLEEKTFQEYFDNSSKEIEKNKDSENNKFWFVKKTAEEEKQDEDKLIDLFDSMDISTFNNLEYNKSEE